MSRVVLFFFALACALTTAPTVAAAPQPHAGFLVPDDASASGWKVVASAPAQGEFYPNLMARASGARPNDPYYPYQLQLSVHNASAAWGRQENARGVVVAVLDTGIAYEDWEDETGSYVLIPDLDGVSFQPGYDFVNDDHHPNDDNHHGTFMAGLIAQSTNNGIGTAALAHGATLLPVKVLDADGVGTLQTIVDGIRFAADAGADVILLSFTFPAGVDPGPPLHAALEYAASRDIILVGASGNDGQPVVSYPAASPHCLAVGAVRTSETGPVRAAYSNWGTAIDVMAFGGDGADRNGDGVPDSPLAQTFLDKTPTDPSYYLMSGTSSAAATVAGAAALLLSNGSSPIEAMDALLASAVDLEDHGFDPQTGFGLVEPSLALAAVASEPPRLDQYDADIHVTVQFAGDNKARLVAETAVRTDNGEPANKVRVYAHFDGVFSGMQGDARTNKQGRAVIRSEWISLQGMDPSTWVMGEDIAISLDRIIVSENPFDAGATAPLDPYPGSNIIIDIPIKGR